MTLVKLTFVRYVKNKMMVLLWSDAMVVMNGVIGKLMHVFNVLR